MDDHVGEVSVVEGFGADGSQAILVQVSQKKLKVGEEVAGQVVADINGVVVLVQCGLTTAGVGNFKRQTFLKWGGVHCYHHIGRWMGV